MLTKSKLAILSFVPLCAFGQISEAQTRNHDLGFMRHNTTALTNSDADRIAADATNVLRTDSGADDISCDVVIRRRGNVGSFSATDGVIDNSSEFVQVEQLSGDVKVVRAINWCGSVGAGIIGCARVPGSSLTMVRFTRSLEGILLAHEFGHNQGLSHRNGTRNLMHPSIGASRVGVNQAECSAFRSPAQMHALPVAASFQAQSSSSSDSLAMIKEHYYHGFPVSIGIDLPPEDAKAIASLLADENEREWWPNALAALGLMGSEISFNEIQNFLTRTNAEDLQDPLVFRAAATAPIALGYYVNVTQDKTALEYMVSAASPERLLNEEPFQGLTSGQEDYALTFAGSFIAGLSLAVTDDDAALNALSDAASRTDEFQSAVSDQIEQAQSEYLRVKEMGLLDYSEK